jgi:glycosyltransferase involved in cell wall biosynthesis
MNERNRVLIFNSAHVVGGAEVSAERIIAGLHQQFRISLLASPHLLARISCPIEKYTFPEFPNSILRKKGGYHMEHLYFRLRALTGSLFDAPEADLVHFHAYDERLLKLFLGHLKRHSIPRVITIHIEMTAEEVASKRLNPKQILDQFSAVVCVCDATKMNLVRLGVSAEKCYVIRNGVDIERFTPNTRPGTFITWIGRVHDDKNVMFFVRVAELAQRRQFPFRFRIVGDGPALPHVQSYLAAHGIVNVELSGWSDDIRGIYRDARVLCLTSTSEALPLVLLEAMASGVPVVSSNVGGIREIVRDDSVGLLLNGLQEADFLEAITSLCQDTNRYTAISRSGRAWIEESFSLRTMLEQTSSLYTTLLTS